MKNTKSEVKQMKAIWSLIAIVVLGSTIASAQTTNQQNTAPPRGTAGSAVGDGGPDAAQNGNAAQKGNVGQSANDARNSNPDATYSNQSRSGSHDWGWIGLLGLAGLAGLRNRRESSASYRRAAAD
jgi:MYXO-CTERM domain-containing protein